MRIRCFPVDILGSFDSTDGMNTVIQFRILVKDSLKAFNNIFIAKRRKKHRELPNFLVYSAANFEPSTLQKGFA